MPRRVFITVGEVSGDRNAANFARELKKLDPDVILEGLGGPAMEAAGVRIYHDTVRKSAMGFRAMLRAWEVHRLLRWTQDHYRRSRPDLHVCVDSWSMNCNFASLAKKNGVNVLYYIAPQAWASREGRVKRLRQSVDRLACILPFEEEWFGSRGVPATFVGHPLFDHLASQERRGAPRDISLRPPVIGLLPGSRRGVAANNFPSLIDVAREILVQFPQASFLIPTTPNTESIVRDALKTLGPQAAQFTAKLDGFDEMVPACDLCITVSGTATLHVASYNVPMIVVYRGSRILWHLLGRWIIRTRTFALVNVLHTAGTGDRSHLVREFIPWYGQSGPVAQAAIEMLKNPRQLQEQQERLRQLIQPLEKPGASRNVAVMAMALMSGKTTSDSPAPPLSSADQISR
ncbi:MAG TPA: hypothetical protein VMD30_13650 [Tepidisphaeraceae bacterium]|nr:hypothetical protein [Tepidisphaeraceae bacterium]